MLEGAKEMVAKRARGYIAPLAIVDAIKAAVENDKVLEIPPPTSPHLFSSFPL
jgi:hypothetical protein